jgi:hypothetical protein
MKKYMIFIVTVIITNSCELFDVDFNQYTIENQTPYTITILAYDRYFYESDGSEEILIHDYPQLMDSIIISPMNKYITEKRIGDDWEPQGFFDNPDVDSVLIYFNSEKVILLVCKNLDPSTCAESKNILNYSLYGNEVFNSKRKGNDYTYFITEDDFTNAELL